MPADSLESEESLARFAQILSKRPLHGPAFAGLVKHYAEQGRLADLVKEYEQKSAALKDQRNLRIVLARVYQRAGQAQNAAAIIDDIKTPLSASADDESKWLAFKSEVYQQTGRMEAAQAMLNEALGRAKTISERLKLAEALADLHVRAGDNKQAAAVLTKLGGEMADSYLHRKRIADALAQRNLHEPAAEEYRAILKIVGDQNDKRCEVLRQLGRSLEQLEKRPEAIDAYTQAVGLLSGGHWLARELNERIVTLYRASGRLQDLVAYCRGQIERSPEQISTRVLLADVQFATGDKDGAKKTLADAIGLFPKDRALSDKRVQLLERIGDPTGIAAEYERIIAQYPDDVELYIGYGQFLANNKQLEAARNQWKSVLKGGLADATLAMRLGGLFEPYELLDDAVECYETAVKMSPQRPEGYTALSRLWFYRGKKDLALEALRRMAAANDKDAGTFSTLASAMLNLGQTDEALAAITKSCELDPRQVMNQLARSDLLVQAGRVNDALEVRRSTLDLINNPGQLGTAIDVLVSMYASSNQLESLRKSEAARLEKEPKCILSMLLLARAADYDRQLVEARKWLTALLKVEPSHEEARRQLARLHEALGDTDAAVEAYKQLCDLYPARARQYFQAIADLKLRYSDKAGAVETFERMVQSAQGNATVLKSVAEQLVRMQEFDKGLKLYEQSLRIQPDFPEVQLAYGKALQEAGKLDEALTIFRATALQRKDRDSAIEGMSRLHEVAGQLGKIDDLLQELQTRVESNPEDTLVARMLAELLIREFEYNRAMDMLDLVLKQHPRDGDLHMVRGDLLRRLARFDESVETYRGILRLPNIDRDFVLGEMGKASFESGKVDQARVTWKQINHKLYAGSLLKNNGLVDDAVEVLREGIRLKPDDFGLHRNLVGALQAAGKIDESLEHAKRLLDLEPDNIFNIQAVAKAYLDRTNRAAAAEVASRLFSAGVTEKKDATSGGSGSSQFGSAAMPVWAMSMQSAWGGSGRTGRNNLERAIEFFEENGLRAELEEALTRQIAQQPDNALLKDTAVQEFAEKFAKPEVALSLLKELETATFPMEHQSWLGQCSQRDFMRVRQYQLIGSKPGLRDKRTGELEPKPADQRTRDETLELAVIHQSQGATDKAIELLGQVIAADGADVVALSAMVDTLSRAERFKDAEPHALALTKILVDQRERTTAEMIERVRRDFVRTLPLRFQVRVSEQLLKDIADKWTLGQSMMGDFTGFVQVMGLFKARLSLATIYAKTGRIDKAREVWQTIEPSNAADADAWTMLAGVAQLHDQHELAYRYYERALSAAKQLAADPLLQQIYSSSLQGSWFGGEQAIDSAFNKIVEAFAGQKKLVELYDFLRDTDQTAKSRRVAEQYKLYDELKALYRARADQAREEFRRAGGADTFDASVPYFTQVAKLAEVLDQSGNWSDALAAYEAYLADFPDELGLLVTLGEVAEAQEDYEKAVAWEKMVIDCKERLQRKAREWVMRSLYVTPTVPRVLGSNRQDRWDWPQRWGKNSWWGYGQNNPLELSPSWMRMAQLYLSLENHIACGDALERAIGAAGSNRKETGEEVLALIKQRQLSGKLLSVLRTLAVQLPTHEEVQLAFAESLEANDKSQVAGEVYRRMMRRGVSDIGTLARVREKLKALAPAAEAEVTDTLQGLEALVKSDADNANNRLRLAKAYYYSLRIDDALQALSQVEKTAPHLEGLHDLLVEVQTIRGDSAALIDALRTKVKRSKNEEDKRNARQRLVQELLAAGRTEDALTELKEVVDAKNPQSYQQVGILFHYFGRHDEAIKQFELASKSNRGGGWGGNADVGRVAVARAMVIKNDLESAAAKILDAVEDQARQASQYAGMGGMYAAYMGDDQSNAFKSFESLFTLNPGLLDLVRARIEKQHADKPDDPQPAKQLMQLWQCVGRPDLADAILEKMTAKGASDQTLVSRLIDRAVERRQYDRAIEMASKWIEQQPKPTLPPGIPAQFAGIMTLMSPRNMMTCKLGDVYWKKGDKDKAFETYHRIIDDKIDESKLAYAAICAMRGRVDESRALVDGALEKQKVKSPLLLQFRAMLALLDQDASKAFDLLAESIELREGQDEDMMSMMGGGDSAGTEILQSFARRAGMEDRFIAFLHKRIDKNPNEWTDHETLATLLYDMGRADDAFAALDAAAKVKSLRNNAMQQRLKWLEGHATADELIKAYQTFITSAEKKVKAKSGGFSSFFGGGSGDPEKIDTQSERDRLASLLWRKGETDEAIKIWSERRDQKSAATHVELGQHFREREAFDRAQASFCKALELAPDDQAAHQELARLAYERGDAARLAEHVRELFLRRGQQSQHVNRGNRYVTWNRGGWSQPQDDSEGDLRQWALAVCDAPQAAEKLSAENAADLRLAAAVLTGDWQSAESLLGERLKSTPYDPLIRRLWATLLERKGDLAAAADAWDFYRRLQLTTLPKHRDLLRLVLAGKHIKDAAAGARTAAAAAMPGMSAGMSSASYVQYGGYYEVDGGGDSGTDSRLAAIYVKLKQFDKAERLYLFGNRGQAQYMLSNIASLMWAQDARARAVELSELAVVLADQYYSQIPQYAGLLAETGKMPVAVELLVRAYRSAHQENSRNAMSAMYAGMYGYSDDKGFEQNEESQISSSLYDILRRNRALDETLTALRAQAAADPRDARLGKLVLSLLMKDRRWKEARESLSAWCKARPEDAALKLELLHADYQLADWTAALAVLNELRAESPESADQWRMHEAFIRVMQGDFKAAVALIEPLLDKRLSNQSGVTIMQVAAMLATTQQYDRLITYLESLHARHQLPAETKMALCRLYRLKQRWTHAARLAASEWWTSENVLGKSDPWYTELCAIVAASRNTESPPEMAPERGEDFALLKLLTDGPAAGRDAFAELCAKSPDNVNARRGLVFALTLLDDAAGAAAANADLTAWLLPRRTKLWHTPPLPPMADAVAAFLDQTSERGLDAAGLLGMGMSFATMINQMLGIGDDGGGSQGGTFDGLWLAHEVLQRELLARAGKTEDLAALAKLHAEYAESASARGSDNDRNRYARYGGFGGAYYRQRFNPFDWDENDKPGFSSDWRLVLRQLDGRYRLMDPAAAQIDEAGLRLPPAEWMQAGEIHAALGHDQDAAKWRARTTAALWARLRATDAPRVQAGDSDNWYWRRFGQSGQEVDRLRQALRAAPDLRAARSGSADDDDDETSDAWEPSFEGNPDSLHELALSDPAVESGLLALESTLTPAWESSATVTELLALHQANKHYDKIITLIERISDPEKLHLSRHVEAYLSACHTRKDFDRIDKLLAAAEKVSADLENGVLLTRLCILRRKNDTAAADTLEKKLLAACRHDAGMAHRLDPVLTSTFSAAYGNGWNRGNPYRSHWAVSNSGGSTIPEFASMLGVRFESELTAGDVTVAELQAAYARHGLYKDAARMVDEQLTRYSASLSPRERLLLLEAKTGFLSRAGEFEAARALISELESSLTAELKANPADDFGSQRLEALYNLKAAGPDRARAYDMFKVSCQRAPDNDPMGLRNAQYLYRLGRLDEAWSAYKTAINRGGLAMEFGQHGRDEYDRETAMMTTTLYRAAMAAQKSGDAKSAQSLLRQAIWRNPKHKLAKPAREQIHD